MKTLNHRISSVQIVSTEKVIGVFGLMKRPVYPPSPRGKRLAELRRAIPVGLSTAAAAIGISREELSGVEFGRYVFRSDDDWVAAEAALKKLSGDK